MEQELTIATQNFNHREVTGGIRFSVMLATADGTPVESVAVRTSSPESVAFFARWVQALGFRKGTKLSQFAGPRAGTKFMAEVVESEVPEGYGKASGTLRLETQGMLQIQLGADELDSLL